jgi:hypothetical protein
MSDEMRPNPVPRFIHDGVLRELAEAKEVVRDLLKPLGPCTQHDHHGNCHTHFIESPCRVERAREWLVSVPKVKPPEPISDDDILDLWRQAKPNPGQAAVMTWHDYDNDHERPMHELRKLVELAIDYALTRLEET